MRAHYAFVLLLRDPDTAFCDRLIAAMSEAQIEFRRGTAGGGNHLRQPYLKKALGEQDLGFQTSITFISSDFCLEIIQPSPKSEF